MYASIRKELRRLPGVLPPLIIMKSDPAALQLEETRMRFIAMCAKAAIPCFLLMAAVYMAATDTPSVTVRGYVLDSACALRKT